jgi:outer membrane protein
VQYSLSSLWKNGAKVQQAKAREKELEVNGEQLSDAIRLQIAQAYQAYLVSVKKIDVYQTAVAQATENYRILKNKYENSLATATDVLDADVAQLQAKLNYAFAKSDALVAYHKLLQASGLLNETAIK